MGKIILFTFISVTITLGFPSMRILDIDQSTKQNDMRAVYCLTNPGENCGPTLRTLWKNVELDNVVQKILKTNFEDKKKLAKIILKSYFKKYSKTQQNDKELKERVWKGFVRF